MAARRKKKREKQVLGGKRESRSQNPEDGRKLKAGVSTLPPPLWGRAGLGGIEAEAGDR